MTESLPDPPVPTDVDLRDFAFTPMFRRRLFESSFHARVSDSEWRAGVTLWLKSWDQVPAGSLPDDDIDLCRLAELGRDKRSWRKIKTGALRGWFKCNDGRLYHWVVAEGVLEAWQRRRAASDKGKLGATKRWRYMPDATAKDSDGRSNVLAIAQAMPGDSKGQGQGHKNPPSPPPSGGTNGAKAPGREPRVVRLRSLAAWRRATKAIDEVNGSDHTWAEVSAALQDPIADQAIELIGGHRLIADRDKYTQHEIQARFRESYEQQLGRSA